MFLHVGLLGHSRSKPGLGTVVCLHEGTMRVLRLVLWHVGGAALFQLETIDKSSPRQKNKCLLMVTFFESLALSQPKTREPD